MSHYDVLILSSPEDVHFRAVDWGLREIGLRSRLLFTNCFPQYETQSLTLCDDSVKYEITDAFGEKIDLLSSSVIWYRRATWPIISSKLSGSDQRAALREAEMFLRGAHSLATLRQHWINNPDCEEIARNKPYQLYVAKLFGLKIPQTFMSNDPEGISNFFKTIGGESIFKTFNSIQWKGEAGSSILFANKIKFDDILHPSTLDFTSHLFQEYINKKYELRIFCFGEKILPFKLETQRSSKTEIDWRISTDGSLRPEPYTCLPEHVHNGIALYMRHMGLEYGAFDFIVDENGDYIFLECNVSGQFLFIEEWNPEIPILSDFLYFITKTIDLTTQQKSKIKTLRYLDFYNDINTANFYSNQSKKYPLKTLSRNIHHESNPL